MKICLDSKCKLVHVKGTKHHAPREQRNPNSRDERSSNNKYYNNSQNYGRNQINQQKYDLHSRGDFPNVSDHQPRSSGRVGPWDSSPPKVTSEDKMEAFLEKCMNKMNNQMVALMLPNLPPCDPEDNPSAVPQR